MASKIYFPRFCEDIWIWIRVNQKIIWFKAFLHHSSANKISLQDGNFQLKVLNSENETEEAKQMKNQELYICLMNQINYGYRR